MKVRITTKIKGSEIIRFACATPLEGKEKTTLFDKIDSEAIEIFARNMISMGLFTENISPVFHVKEFWVEGREINLGNLKIKGNERK